MRNLISVFALGLLLLVVAGCALLDAPPVAQIAVSPTSGRAPLTVSLDASASLEGRGLCTYVWELAEGDGLMAKRFGVRSSHTFERAGTYEVLLTVADAGGRLSTARELVTVVGDEGALGLLRIVSWELVHEPGQPITWTLHGSAECLSDAPLRYGGVSADFYDAQNQHLGSGIDLTFELLPGALWEFVIPLTDADPEAIVDHAMPFVSGASL